MKKIINILLKILDCITLRGIVEREGERHAAVQRALKMHRNGELFNDDYIKIPLDGRKLENLNIIVNDEVFDLSPDIGNEVVATIATENPLNNGAYNWSPYSDDDKEVISAIKREIISPAVYKLDNGDYDVFIRINGVDTYGYCGHVIESNEPKNYPLGRYSSRWNLNNMSKVINYGE